MAVRDNLNSVGGVKHHLCGGPKALQDQLI